MNPNATTAKEQLINDYANRQSNFKVGNGAKIVLPLLALGLLILLVCLFKHDLKKYPVVKPTASSSQTNTLPAAASQSRVEPTATSIEEKTTMEPSPK